MSSLIGRTLSHYEIVSEISRGGMGVVYRARDTRLNRDVALKVLPPDLVADPDRRARFVQEAQAASAIEHPHTYWGDGDLGRELVADARRRTAAAAAASTVR